MRASGFILIEQLVYRLIYGTFTYLCAFYLAMIPCALLGYYGRTLLRPMDWPGNSGHVILSVVIWIAFGTRKVIVPSFILTTIVTLFVLGYFSHWILFVDGDYSYAWVLILLLLVMPTSAAILLSKANVLAPKLLKNWRSDYAR
jgi:hypothetical protein